MIVLYPSVLYPSVLSRKDATLGGTPIYDSNLKKGIDHVPIQGITGSNIFIQSLPQLNQRVLGREEKVSEILDCIQNSNHSVMIVGKPGFGKSTLAWYAGERLKHEGLEVHWVDTDNHFTERSLIREIKAFYQIIYDWSDERTKQTVLILDDFDKMLVTSEKKAMFKEKFLKKMSAYSRKVRLIITTQIEAFDHNFHLIRAGTIDRRASIEMLNQGYYKTEFTYEQKNTTAGLVEDCPFALELVIQIIGHYQSNDGIEDPIQFTIEMLQKSRQKESISEHLPDYNHLMSIAYGHLTAPSQCCGCCIGRYPGSGSFSSLLFPLMEESPDVPCTNSSFKDCVDGLVGSSLLDEYTLDGVRRFRMHSLIKSFFHSLNEDHNCHESYRFMFSRFFSTYCTLNELYGERDVERTGKILASDHHHLERLLLYIKAYGSRDKYEATVLMIAYQRGQLRTSGEQRMLYEAVCKCEECVGHVIETMGSEAFGQILMNVSAEIHNSNFVQCELITNNFCSRALLLNSNHSTSRSLFNTEVLKITCGCLLMHYFHIMGTVGILGTIPFLLLLKHARVGPLMARVKIDIQTAIFIYLNFLPTVVKLYFGQDIEKIWLNVYVLEGDAWIYTNMAQLVYECLVICLGGHMFQQREVFYALQVRLVRIKNIVMLLLYMGLPVAMLQGDFLGMFTLQAAKWNVTVLSLLLVSRYYLFDYVTTKMSNGIILRLFFRLILSGLNASSEFSCRFVFYTISLQYQNPIFLLGSMAYTIIIARLTAALMYYLDIM